MSYIQKTCFIVCILFIFSCSEKEKKPGAVKGTLDLTHNSLSENRIIKLDGEWEFYWKQLLKPDQINDQTNQHKEYFTLPGTWKGHSFNNTKLPRYGFATFKLTVKTNKRGLLYLYFTTPNAASIIWINGKIHARYGTVSRIAENEKVSMGTKILEFNNQQDKIEIVIQTSNFHKYGSGIVFPLKMGEREKIYFLKIKSVASDIFIFAILLIICFYHLSLYLLRQKEKASLFFSLFSFIYAIRTLVINEQYLVDIFPLLHWQFFFRIDFLSIALIVPLVIKFISYLYADEMFTIINKIFYGIGIIYAGMSLLSPISLFLQFLVYFHFFMIIAGMYIIYVLIAATIKKREGAFLSLIGFIVLSITGFYDILVAHEIIDSMFISPIGILIFFLLQTLNLSYRFSKAFKNVEQFSVILEKEVNTRTIELQKERNILKEWNENINKELNLAKKIQQKLIAEQQPASYISSLYKPMEKIGGDFIDFLHFREANKIGIFISDVSGHGVPAAFITSMIKTSLLQSGKIKENPAELLLFLNETLLHYTAENFVTALYGIYDSTNKHFKYSIAGHHPPCVISDDTVTHLGPHKSLPLAIMDKHKLHRLHKLFTNYDVSLSDYKKVLLYTDGLIEARHLSHEGDFFIDNIMLEVVEKNKNLQCAQFIDSLYQGLLQFRGSDNFDDDVCMICIDL